MRKTSKTTATRVKAEKLVAKRAARKPAPVEIDEDDVEELHTPNSVVKPTYKLRYAERAAHGVKGAGSIPKKALKRSTNDWLALELGKRVLDPKAKLVVPSLLAILEANGIDHTPWSAKETRGWQGRLRMSGRLALQRVVAEAGELVVPGEGAIPAPRAWVAKHVH